jgi:hypothetical protein
MTVQEAMLALTAHQRAIEQLAEAWPTGSESPINSFRETVRNVLSDMGWDKGKGKQGVTDRQFSNWLKMIAPTIPPKKKHYGATAYREILYLAYWMHEGGGHESYLNERKKRLGIK